MPSFAYDPADFLPQQLLLFKLSRSLSTLKDDICKTFAGKTLTMREIYEQHNVDTPFIRKNYKDALRQLYSIDKKISALTKSGKEPRKETFGDDILVTFS